MSEILAADSFVVLLAVGAGHPTFREPLMPDTLAALTAAGIVYDRSDFADPHLSGPTALTVTADGRVFGHLATWGTPHIGMGARVTPPKSPSGYQYFHQGVVRTSDGDLPVGKLTLGTGHAPVDGRTDAMAAAAHYDNTGSVAAVVRAGEDQHGIYLAGRLVPGTTDDKVDELRRSGVSGDWRGINGQYELVAALAVNTPGFPIPRTEELVASGIAALVAAGVVVPEGATVPQNREQFDAVLAAAVAERVDTVVARELDARSRRTAAAARVRAVVASGRRSKLAGLVAAVVADELEPVRADGMVALVPTAEDAARLAVDGGETVEDLHLTVGYFDDAALMPADDEELVAAVTAALPVVEGIAEGQMSGRAVFDGDDGPASVYLVQADGLTAAHQAAAAPPSQFDAYVPHITAAYGGDVEMAESGPIRFDRVRISRAGESVDYPLGEGMTAAGRRIRSAEGAERYGLSIGDLIPDAKAIGEAVGNDVGRAAEGVAKALGAKPAPKNTTPAEAKPDAESGEKEPAAEPVEPKTDTPAESAKPEPVAAPKSGPGAPVTDTPETDVKPDTSQATTTPNIERDADGKLIVPKDAPAPRLEGDGSMEEDQSPYTGAFGGELTDFSDGIARYDDGSWTDGTEWNYGDEPTDTPDETQAEDPATESSEPEAADLPDGVNAGDPVTDTDVAVRLDGDPGTRMEEDQAPETGAHGGELLEIIDGVAFYADGTDTDGTTWRWSEPVDAEKPVTASLWSRTLAAF